MKQQSIGDIMREKGMSYEEAKANLNSTPRKVLMTRPEKPSVATMIREGEPSELAHRFFKPPFVLSCGAIVDADGHKILDVRGWGHLIGRGQPEFIDDGELAAKVQDWLGERIAEVMTEHLYPAEFRK